MRRSRLLEILAPAGMCVLVVAGSACAGPDRADESSGDGVEIDAVADATDAAGREVGDTDAPTELHFADDVDPEGVVTAALLIASGGDLEAAIIAGLITADDAELALDALERGSLDALFD